MHLFCPTSKVTEGRSSTTSAERAYTHEQRDRVTEPLGELVDRFCRTGDAILQFQVTTDLFGRPMFF